MANCADSNQGSLLRKMPSNAALCLLSSWQALGELHVVMTFDLGLLHQGRRN